MRRVLLLSMLFIYAQATEVINPFKKIVIDGGAKDMVVHGEHIYIGTDEGKMQSYNYKLGVFDKEVKFPDIKDFMGDVISTRVSSLDYIDGRFLMVTDSGIGGYANLWMHENNVTTQVLSHKDKKVLVKARFVDKEHILFGYLGNEAALFNIAEKKEKYRVQLAPSKFSDFALNADRSRAAFGCESGIISVIDSRSGKLITELKGVNLDNVYKVDIKNGTVAGAGQDRRGSIYSVATATGDYMEGEFLIYATGLSPSAKKVAFAMDEQNNISVYNSATKSKLAIHKGQKSTLNSIIFADENTIFSASDDDTVIMWKIK